MSRRKYRIITKFPCYDGVFPITGYFVQRLEEDFLRDKWNDVKGFDRLKDAEEQKSFIKENEIMTRKEEINEQSFVNGFNDHDKEIFTIGVEFADSRPRKGLVSIEKACKWLKNNIHDYYSVGDGGDEFEGYFDEMIVDFKKAMEN